jgi:hypothetical protein
MLIYLIIVLMKTILTYRGKQITTDDVAYIKQMLTDNPDLSRNALSIIDFHGKNLPVVTKWATPQRSIYYPPPKCILND